MARTRPGERHVQECEDCSGEVGVGDLVACMPPINFADDDPASAQTGHVIRGVRPRPSEFPRELRWVSGRLEQREQDARPRRTRPDSPMPLHHVGPRGIYQNAAAPQCVIAD